MEDVLVVCTCSLLVLRVVIFHKILITRTLFMPGMCSNALAFASANENAAFALAFYCHEMDAFALAFVFDSFAFAIALAFDSNAFD